MKKFIVIFSLLFISTSLSQPPKLPNCGNTCYLNAATQAPLCNKSINKIFKTK